MFFDDDDDDEFSDVGIDMDRCEFPIETQLLYTGIAID